MDCAPMCCGASRLVFVSGGLLFWAEAAEVIASPAWVFKFAFIGLAGLNALYFELVIARRPDALSPERPRLPRGCQIRGPRLIDPLDAGHHLRPADRLPAALVVT